MLRVRDLLQNLELHLIAGEGGLDAAIRGVQNSDLPDPTPWLSTGDLLLSTGVQLGGESDQREFVGRLAEHRVSGLGLPGGRLSDGPNIHPTLVAAEHHGLPLFEVREQLPFIAVARTASELLAGEQHRPRRIA